MRFRLAAVVAVGLACTAVAVAHAANTYTLKASTSPGGAGTPAAPKAKTIALDYGIAGEGDKRPAPLRDVHIDVQGVIALARAFPSCTMTQAEEVELVDVLAACERAQVGSGRVETIIGLSHDASDKVPCELELRVFNLGKRRIALRLDRKAEEDCLVDPEMAFEGTLRRIRISGRATDRASFSLPELLRHPVPGLETAIVRVQATLSSPRRRAKVSGRWRRVGFFSSVACGKRRLVRVTAVDESGATTRSQVRTRC